MGKQVSDGVYDNGLNHVVNNVERMVVCDSEPADYTAVAGAALGDAAFGAVDITGPQAGGGGRQIVFDAVEGMDVDESGNADHVALVDDSSNELLLVTTLSNPQGVTQGNTMDVASFSHTIEDPV